MEDNIERKYTEKYEVLTSNGFQSFHGIRKIRDKQSYKITFDDGDSIVCSYNHKFYEQGKTVYFHELHIGDTISSKKITNITDNGTAILYDLLEVENGHHYTCNNNIELKNCSFVPKNRWNAFFSSVLPTITSGKDSMLILISCVTRDTIIVSTDGLHRISDYIDETYRGAYSIKPYKVLGMDSFRTGELFYNSGFSKILIIRTRYSFLKCSPNHKLWVSGEWKEAQNLSPSDKLTLQAGMNIYGTSDYKETQEFSEIFRFSYDATRKYILSLNPLKSSSSYFFPYSNELRQIFLNMGYLTEKDSSYLVLSEEDYNSIQEGTKKSSFVLEDEIISIDFSEDYVYDFSLDDTSDPFSHSVSYNSLIGHQTPNGKNHFYDFWKGAKEGTNGFFPMEVNWWDVPGRDEKWRQEILSVMSEAQFNIEYGNSFESSSNTLISPEFFYNISETIKKPIQETKQIKIYDVPEQGHTYFATCDCASVGKDYSTVSVLDISVFPYRQVATFMDNKVSHLVFPQFIINLCKKYNSCEVLVESNEIGTTILHILNYELDYDNIVKTYSASGQVVLGQKTTSKTKTAGCARMKDLIETGNLIIQDQETLQQLRHFSVCGDSFSGEEGYFDDMVMGLVNFSYYATTPRFKMIYDKSFVDEVMDKSEQDIYESLAPLPMFSGNNYGEYLNEKDWLND